MATGTVKWFNSEKGFGFIAPDGGGEDVFAHFSNIAASGYRSLQENDRVEFEVGEGRKGPQAENITVLP
jgi:cold shock protein